VSRPRDPDNIKQFRGTFRSDRSIPSAQPPQASISPPRGLSKEERAIWRRVAPVLSAAGLLTEADVSALAKYCRLEALHTKLLREDFPTLVPGSMGQMVANPIFKIITDLQTQMERMYRQFGMTPSSRAGIRVEKHELVTDPMEELLEGRG